MPGEGDDGIVTVDLDVVTCLYHINFVEHVKDFPTFNRHSQLVVKEV